MSVTNGRENEPDQLIRGHDTNNTTGLFNPRTRLFDAALTRQVEDGDVVGIDLRLADQAVKAHRARIGDRGGRSEITAPLRLYTDAAVRTLISMDVNREFFSAPQRYAIGMSADDFIGPDGNSLSPWQILTGRVWSTGEVSEASGAASEVVWASVVAGSRVVSCG